MHGQLAEVLLNTFGLDRQIFGGPLGEPGCLTHFDSNLAESQRILTRPTRAAPRAAHGAARVGCVKIRSPTAPLRPKVRNLDEISEIAQALPPKRFEGLG